MSAKYSLQRGPFSTGHYHRRRFLKCRPFGIVLLIALMTPLLACSPGIRGAGAQPQYSPTAEPSPTATKPPTPRPSPTAVPTATATAVPTATSVPTVTPRSAPPTAKAGPNQPVPVKGEIARGNTAFPKIALTFDAGSGASGAPTILATLREKHVKATFFFTGDWVQKFPDVARQIVAEGHELGNHSFTHPDFTKLSDEQARSEIERTENAVLAATGHSTKPFFRPPFGARDNRVIALIESLGYRSIYWTLDSADWRDDATSAGVLSRVTNNASNGSIMIMHVDSKASPPVLGQIIDSLRAQGYSLVPLSELIAS